MPKPKRFKSGVRRACCLAGMLAGSYVFLARTASGSPPASTRAAAPTHAEMAVPAGPAGNGPRSESFGDAEILACLLAVDSNEIAAATVAQGKTINSETRQFAQLLQDQHREDAAKTIRLAHTLNLHPSSHPTYALLRSQAAWELPVLHAMEGKEFERTYVDAMVSDHRDALELIDSQLLPHAKDQKVKKRLAEARMRVALHLEYGKSLQGI